MKIRQGFVSNSSSSSFCIYGVEIDHKELFELAVRLGFKTEEEEPAKERDGVDLYDYENSDPYDLINYINEQDIVKVKCFDAYCSENYYIGREFKSIGDKETGKSFKKAIENELDELDILELPKTIEEAWHD